METTGAALTVIETVAVEVLPPLSVTEAVIVCAPLVSELVIEAPLPSAPSWLELHWMLDDRSPSSGSVAVPVNVTGRSGAEIVLSGGAEMLTTGGAFTVIALNVV